MKKIREFYNSFDPNIIVKEYHENKNGELFLERLLAIDEIPKDINDEMTWYLNIATAFHVLGR